MQTKFNIGDLVVYDNQGSIGRIEYIKIFTEKLIYYSIADTIKDFSEKELIDLNQPEEVSNLSTTNQPCQK